MNLMQIMICLAALADTPDCPLTMDVLAELRPCRSKAARLGTKRKLTPRFPMSPTCSCNRTHNLTFRGRELQASPNFGSCFPLRRVSTVTDLPCGLSPEEASLLVPAPATLLPCTCQCECE